MKDILQVMVDYIEENLNKDLSLDFLAEHIGYSKFYLNRVFSVYTGLSVIEYVRKRRLNAAMAQLDSDKRVLDIALDYGYNSERAFSRAFQKEFGNSPGFYRKVVMPYKQKLCIHDLSLNLTSKSLEPSLHPDLDYNVSRKGVSEIMSYLSDVKYVTLPVMTVLSATIFGSEPEEEVINLMHEFAKEKGLSPLREFGFDVPIESEKPVEEWRGYEFWLSISGEDLDKLGNHEEYIFKDNKIVIKNIPSYRYASLSITDPFTEAFVKIPAGWKALISWLEDNEFKEGKYPENLQGYCLEEVTEVNGVITMDIFIPVNQV